jgi:hypothetical protein
MHMRFRMPSAGTLIACLALFAALGGSAVAASSLLTGSDVKNNSLTGKDVKPGSIGLARLTKGTQALIKAGGAVGGASTGATGAQGAAGANGANGAQGPKGDKGDPGTPGAKGADALTKVPALPGGGWAAYQGTCDDTPGAPTGVTSITGGHAQFGSTATAPFTDGNMYAGITRTSDNAKLGDIAYLTYTTHYTQTPTDQHGAAPYVTIKTTDGTNTHSYAFSPNTQPHRTVTAGLWQRWSVTEGTVRRDDDAGGPGPDPTWDEVVGPHANETVTRISIVNGCSIANGALSQVDDVEMDLAGTRSVYDFG